MAWLTAALAFATTMLVFALIVSMLVEAIHRVLGLRHQGMKLLLESIFTRVIQPYLAKNHAAGAVTAEQFSAWIMENRPLGGDDSASQERRGRAGWLVIWLGRTTQSANIPTEIFTQRLVDSRMVEVADALSEEAVKDIAQQYEAYGKEITEFFRARAQVFSIVIAFGIAFAFHIHPYELARAYLNDPVLAERVAGHAEELRKEYEEHQAEIRRRMEALPADQAGQQDGDLKQALSDLLAEMRGASERNAALARLGAPVGWPELGVCTSTFGFLSASCRFETQWFPINLPSLGSVFWLLVGGALIGLGAPFWAQAVGSLSTTNELVKRLSAIVNPPAAGDAQTTFTMATARAAGASPALPATPARPAAVSTFETARAIRDGRGSVSPR